MGECHVFVMRFGYIFPAAGPAFAAGGPYLSSQPASQMRHQSTVLIIMLVVIQLIILIIIIIMTIIIIMIVIITIIIIT